MSTNNYGLALDIVCNTTLVEETELVVSSTPASCPTFDRFVLTEEAETYLDQVGHLWAHGGPDAHTVQKDNCIGTWSR